ncbi:uncharacterized protein LOC134268880 [Saccostrea cucullata]|uniref:uncharacterized protein LOC134268880 n=1 Tax=Saccostrea cuccullata TaxID=36930 RepID=UPI002ED0EC31
MANIHKAMLLAISTQAILAEKGPCSGFFNGCCPNTQWSSEHGTCINCSIGYFWINCSRSCTYPYFGARCQNKCLCAKQSCNFVEGCLNEKEKQNDNWSQHSRGVVIRFTNSLLQTLVIVASIALFIVLVAYLILVNTEQRTTSSNRPTEVYVIDT